MHELERRKSPPCDINSKIIGDLEKDMYGNGSKGIKMKVTVLEVNMKTLRVFLYLTIPPIFLGVLGIAAKMIFFM